MSAVYRYAALTVVLLALSSATYAQGSWVQVPTALQSNPSTHVQVGGLWGIAMADSGTGFAAGYASVAGGFSGVLRKTAGNPTWFVLPASSFSLLPANHSLWSAVTVVGMNVWVSGSNGRLYKSSDNGNSWAPSMNGMTGTNSLFDVFFKNANEGMAVGSGGKLYYTSDGGANWVAQTLPGTIPANTDMYAVHSAGNFWYVCGGSHIMIKGTPQSSSTSWVDMTSNLPTNVGLIEGLQFLDDNVGTIAGVIATGSPIHRTVNGATSFSSIGATLPAGTYNAVHFFDQANGWVGNAQPALYHTTNSGSAWTQATVTPLPSQNITNWLTRITFVGTQTGYASGGAPGTSSTGWVLKFVPAQPPDISSTPTSFDFGTFSCGNSIEKLFTISNLGAGSLNISAITFSHPEFSMVAPIPTPVPPLGGATFGIRWTPSQPGPAPANARMTILSNDPANPSWVVDLTGVFNSGTLTLGAPGIYPHGCFGDSVDITLTSTVTGTFQPQLITFEHVSGATGVRLVSPLVGSTLSGSALMTFRYTPPVAGPWSGTYRIIYGDPLCPKIAMVVFDGDARSSTMTAVPDVVDFGEVCIGKHKDMLITLTNTGTVNAIVSSRTHVGGRDAFPNQHFAPFGPIAPNDSRQYTVRFAPVSGDIGPIEGVYKLIVDPCGDSVLIVLRGIGVEPRITFSPTNLLALGPVPIGQTSEEQVTITNSGSGNVMIDAIALKPPHPRVTLTGLPALPAPLGPSQSIIVTARFTPDRIETVISELSVRYSGPCSDSVKLPVIASSASAPTIAVQALMDMGENVCPDPLIDTLWVRNLGPGLLTMSRFSIGGRDASHFAVLPPGAPAFVAAGDSSPVYIACNAPAPGISEAELTIEHDDPKTFNSSVVQLRAERILIGWRVEGDSTSSMVSCVGVGVSRTFTVRNTGLRPRTVKLLNIISGGGVFHVASSPLPMEVPPGSSRSFEVTFTPTAQGNVSGMLEIIIGPCGEAQILRLRGKGSQSELTINPSPIDFGTVNVGAEVVRSLRIANPGTSAATVTALVFRPPLPVGSEHYSIESAPSLPFELNSGEGLDIEVRFAPQAVASYSGELCIVASTPCPDTICVSLAGKGTSSGLGLNRTRLDYALDPCTLAEKCDTVEVHNYGSLHVTLNSATFDDAGWFTVTPPSPLPMIIPPGSKATFTVCARSGFSGTRSTILRIATTDFLTPELRVAVAAVRDSSSFHVIESTLDFGAIASCEIGATKTITIANSGLMMEIIDTLRSTNPFEIVESLPVVIQPAQQRTLTVRFAPTSYGVFNDTLYFVSARCGQRIALLLHGEYHEINTIVTPDPLVFANVPIGSNSIRNLTLGSPHLALLRIADVRIQPSGDFASWGSYPKIVARGDTLNLPIQYSPQSAGQHNAIACIIIDQPCPDTICVVLQGSTSDGELRASPSALDFGDVAQCADFFLKDTVRNLSSTDVRISDARIEGTDAANFELLDGIVTEETLPPGGIRIFTIRVRPTGAADGQLSASLVLDNSGTPAQFGIPIAARRITVIADGGGTVNYGQMLMGAPGTRTVTLHNSGSAPLHYTAVAAPAGIVLSPPLPFTVLPGTSLNVDITFTPASPGLVNDMITLYVVAPCKDSTRYQVLADVDDGGLVSLDMGVVPGCLPATGIITLRNTQIESVSIAAFSFEGPDAATMRVLSPTVLPLDVAPGDSIQVTVEFNAGGGGERQYNAVLVAEFRISTITVKARSPITVFAHNGRLTGAASWDFGQNSIVGLGSGGMFTFTNNAAFPIHIAQAAVSGAGFTFLGSTPTLPLTLQPGDRVEFRVAFLPTEVRTYTGTLTFEHESPCPSTHTMQLLGEGIDDRTPVVLSLPRIQGAPDDIIEIPITIDRDLGGLVTEWSGEISYNASMLHPMDVRLKGTLSEGMQLIFTYDQVLGRIRLSLSGAPLRGGAGVIAIVRCLVLIGNDMQTPLRIEQGFSFGTGGRVQSTVDGEFTLIDYCDADGLRLVGDRAGLRIVSSTPSPFDETLTIAYELDDEGRVDLRLFDAAGREVAVLLDEVRSSGQHSITAQLPGLNTGMYFCILRHNGRAVHSRIMKSR